MIFWNMKRGKKIWVKILQDLLLLLLFTLLPTWIKLLWDAVVRNDLDLVNFYYRGEFLLYAVAILSSSLMLLEFYNTKKRIWCVVPLVIISIFYVIVFSALNGTSDPLANDLNIPLLFWFSFAGMLAAIFAFIVGQYLQYTHTNTDVGEIRHNEQSAIENSIKE